MNNQKTEQPATMAAEQKSVHPDAAALPRIAAQPPTPSDRGVAASAEARAVATNDEKRTEESEAETEAPTDKPTPLERGAAPPKGLVLLQRARQMAAKGNYKAALSDAQAALKEALPADSVGTAWAVVAAAACHEGKASLARQAYPKAGAELRAVVVKLCRTRNVSLEDEAAGSAKHAGKDDSETKTDDSKNDRGDEEDAKPKKSSKRNTRPADDDLNSGESVVDEED